MKYHVIRVIRSKNVFSVVFNYLMIILREKKKKKQFSREEKRNDRYFSTRSWTWTETCVVSETKLPTAMTLTWKPSNPVSPRATGEGIETAFLAPRPSSIPFETMRSFSPPPLPSSQSPTPPNIAGLEREGRGSRKWRAPLTKKELLLSSFRASLSKHRSPINARKALWEREREKDLTSLLNKEESQDIDSNEL